jgi:hypothetical protein
VGNCFEVRFLSLPVEVVILVRGRGGLLDFIDRVFHSLGAVKKRGRESIMELTIITESINKIQV